MDHLAVWMHDLSQAAVAWTYFCPSWPAESHVHVCYASSPGWADRGVTREQPIGMTAALPRMTACSVLLGIGITSQAPNSAGAPRVTGLNIPLGVAHDLTPFHPPWATLQLKEGIGSQA